MKNKKYVTLGTALFVLVILVGGLFMNATSGEWSERNREGIEENVRNYVERYKLDPDKVEIVTIGNPRKYPTGEEEFRVYFRYYGDPYFAMYTKGNPDTLTIIDQKEHIVESVFNMLYLQARYEELAPTMDYLKSLGIEDPLRLVGEKVQFFQTNVGLNSQINDEIKEAYKSGDDLEDLKDYIDTNLEKLRRLDTNIRIVGEKEGIDDAQAFEIEEELIRLLPITKYYIVEIGVEDLSTGENEGLFKTLKIREER